MGMIWYLSSLSSTELPSPIFTHQDKVLHYFEYMILGITLAFACKQSWPTCRDRHVFSISLSLGSIWAALDEFHQQFIPGRSPEGLDLLVDVLGLSCGALCWIYVCRVREKSQVSRV